MRKSIRKVSIICLYTQIHISMGKQVCLLDYISATEYTFSAHVSATTNIYRLDVLSCKSPA